MAMIRDISKSVRELGTSYIGPVISPVPLRALTVTLVSRGWLFLDIMASLYLHSKPLRQDKLTTIKLRIRSHRGRSVRLDDNSIVNPGDSILEIHLNNDWFLYHKAMMHSPGKTGLEFLAAFCDDLKYLARKIDDETFTPEIKAIYGRTLLRQSPGNQRLGFTVMDLPDSRWRQLSQFYLAGLRQAYYPQWARRSLTKAKPLAKREIWMSKDRLLHRYGPSNGS